jgi:hypothetical protein
MAVYNFLLLADTMKTMFYVLPSRVKLDYTILNCNFFSFFNGNGSQCTVNSTSVYTLWTWDRSQYKGIRANIELQL